MKPLAPHAAVLALLILAGLPALPAASFGPGRVQLIAGGGGEIVFDAPAKEAALRFTAERDGALTSVKFASRIGTGWTEPVTKLFVVTLYSDNAGKPGRALATGESAPTAPGARAREAAFKNVLLKKGQSYHLVIAVAPGVDAGAQFSVNYFLFDARSQPLDSFDMATPAKGSDVLVSADGGTTWAPVGGSAAGAMSLMIGGRPQGWGYTNSYDARLWHAPGDDRQVLMQSFKFTTGGQGGSGQVADVSFAVRAQGALAGVAVPLRVRLLERGADKPLGESAVSVTPASTGGFFTVEAPFKHVVLKEGGEYVLSIDISAPVGATAADYLFVRTFTWGYGNPSLVDVGWQGGEHSMIQGTALDPAAGQAVEKVDLPFVIDYSPAR